MRALLEWTSREISNGQAGIAPETVKLAHGNVFIFHQGSRDLIIQDGPYPARYSHTQTHQSPRPSVRDRD